MELLAQRIVDGIGDGVIYGLLALALVMIFRSTRILNFAQGEMAMFCTMVVWKLTSSSGLGLPLLLAIASGIIAGFILGAGLERVVMRPFEGGDHLRQAMVTMGLFLAINALGGYLFTLNTQQIGSPFPSGGLHPGGVRISYQFLGLLGVALVVSTLLWAFFSWTRVGLGMRAASTSPQAARVHGVNVPRMLMLGWALSGALGALAGALLAPSLFVSSNMMLNILLYAFAAAAVGGFDSAPGALVGGVIVGLVQHLAAGYIGFIGNQLQLATALFVILVVLLIRPQGLFGSKLVQRV